MIVDVARLSHLQVLDPRNPPSGQFTLQLVIEVTIGEKRLVIDQAHVLDSGQSPQTNQRLTDQTLVPEGDAIRNQISNPSRRSSKLMSYLKDGGGRSTEKGVTLL